jgi:hypothetical protein
VAVIVRNFRCLQGKEARQAAKKAGQRGRRERRAGRRIRQRPTKLARSRVDARIGIRPSSREIRLEEGTNQSSEPAGRWDCKRGPCEIDDVTRAEFRGPGGPASHGGGQRAVTK